MGLKICLGIFFVLFLFLLIPIRYRFILEIKHLAVTVEFISGFIKNDGTAGKETRKNRGCGRKIEEFLLQMRGGLPLPRGQK